MWKYYPDSFNAQLLVYYADGLTIKTKDKRRYKEIYPDGTIKQLADESDYIQNSHTVIKASYHDGVKAWQKHLKLCLTLQEWFKKIRGIGIGGILVVFTIDTTGEPTNMLLERPLRGECR